MNRDVCKHFVPTDLPCDKCESVSVQKNTLREAAQQALEALEMAEFDPHSSDAVHKAITALKAALAEPVQKPVAWMVYTLDGKSVCVTDNPNDFTPEHRALPLYTRGNT